MLLDSPTASRGRAQTNGHCRVPGRVWHRPESKSIPDEPGWAVTVAAVSLAREADEKYRWHDGAETSCNVARRALWRFAHGRKLPDGSKSGRFACAFPELVHAFGRAGLFPKAGEPPRYDQRSEEWHAYLKRTRTQARRICDRLETAGIAVVREEKDNRGRDWRVVVELLAVDVDAERLGEAKRRHRSDAWSRRRDRSEARGVLRDLRAIARAAKPLTKAEKARLHKVFHQHSRQRAEHQGDLCNQREASRPSVAKPNADSEQTSTSPFTSQRRGAHARRVPPLRGRFATHPQAHRGTDAPDPSTPYRDDVTEREGRSINAAAGAEGFPYSPRELRSGDLTPSGGLQGSGVRLAVSTAQIASMAPTVDQLTPATAGAIVQSWWRLRRGLSAAALPVVDDTAAAIDELAAWRRRAAALERLADHRPAGWPTSGAAMLFTLAVIRDVPPGTFALGAAADELLTLMHHDEHAGGRAVNPLGSYLPPQVPAGYEGIATMRRRLTEQLQAAGDSIDAYPTLAAAERAAVDHEHSGRLPLGRDVDWDAPWNRDRPQRTLWPAPSVQRSWRHRLLPPLPAEFAPLAVDHLAEPATYTAAIERIRRAQPGTTVTRHVAEDLVQAFHAERFGITGAIAIRTRWRPKGGLAEIQTVVDAYEALSEHRPKGWPACGLAAILVTATWRDPGSYEHDGTPVRLNRPDKLPMALGLMRLLIDNMERLSKRGSEIEAAKRRRRGRGGRSPEHHARKSAKQQAEAGPQRFNFRSTAGAPMPAPAETPADTYTRIRTQLLSIGRHAADYPSLEDAELALIDLEIAGQLPGDAGRSPIEARQARLDHARSTGPAAIAAAEWEHLAASAVQWLAAGDARRLADVEAVSINDGRLILTGSADTLDWAKTLQLTRVLEHVARDLDIAHSATLIAAEHAAVFRPTAELRGPADHRAARADRYADERLYRFAIEDRS